MDENKLHRGVGPTDPRPGMPHSSPGAQDMGSPPDELAEKAAELASSGVDEAKRLTSATKERVLRQADEKKGMIADKLEELARNIDEVGAKGGGDEEDLSRRLAESAARTVRSVERTLNERSTEELLAAAGRELRQRPGLLMAGCFALGFLGARLLRR
jgi:hypothetical protein